MNTTNKSTLFLCSTLMGLSLCMGATANTLAFWNDNPKAKVVSRTMDLTEYDSPLLRASAIGIVRIGDLGKFHLSWQSKYKTVVVTAFNSNVTTDGINDQGLSAHLLPQEAPVVGMKPISQEPINVNLPTLSNALWVQYILDNYKTVAEVIDGVDEYRITDAHLGHKEITSHMAIQDATGDSAFIEIQNGIAKVYHGKELNVVTNMAGLDQQLDNLTQYSPFGGEKALPGDNDANSRFVRTAAHLKSLPMPTSSAEAVAGVESIIWANTIPHSNQGPSTRWVSTADLTNGVLYFHNMSMPGSVWVDIKRIKLDPNSPTIFFNPNQLYRTGDVTRQFKKQS